MPHKIKPSLVAILFWVVTVCAVAALVQAAESNQTFFVSAAGAMEHHDRLFLLFQRLQDRNKYPGSGIGLAIWEKIIERRGGRIWVESTPGRGATCYGAMPASGGEKP